jgi:hypothetical protein
VGLIIFQPFGATKREKVMTNTRKNALHEGLQITAPTSAERKRAERERDKAKGLIRRDVKAHPDDWAEIRALELKLRSGRDMP